MCVLLTVGIAGAVFTSCTPTADVPTPVTLSLSRTTLSVAAVPGGRNNFDIKTTPNNLGWVVDVNWGNDWCTVSPDSGAGKKNITLNIAENTSFSARSATITVTAIMPNKKVKPLTQQLTVTQAAVLANLSVDKTGVAASIEANSYPIVVTGNVGWIALPDAAAPWCSLSPVASGTGYGIFSIVVEKNSLPSTRTATITVMAASPPSVPPLTITVTQAFLPPAFSVDRPTIYASTVAHSYPVAVTANGEWTAAVDAGASSWCTIENPVGVGSGTFVVSVRANPTSNVRKAKITVSSRGATMPINVYQVFDYAETAAGFDMIGVPGGTFTMGGSADSDERPQHSVTITKNYAIGKFEVTQKLWMDLMGDWPNTDPHVVPRPPGLHSEITNMIDDDCPMYYVNSADIQRFLTALNEKTGKEYRLPTEAEWENAARGSALGHGYLHSGSNSIDKVAWYIDNSGRKTHPVGTLAPNELGIYDMSGNVWELCSDWFGPYGTDAQIDPTGPALPNPRDPCYVARGGALDYENTFCSVSYRMRCPPGADNYHLGFRLALTLDDVSP